MSHDETWRRGSTPGAASIDVRENAEGVFLEAAAAFAQPEGRYASRAPRRTVGDGASVTSARTGISEITAARSSMHSLHTEGAEQPVPASASEPDTSAGRHADSSVSSVTHSVLTRPDGVPLNELSLAARRRQRELAGAQPSAGPARTVILHADEPTLALAGGGTALEWQEAAPVFGSRAVTGSATDVPQAGELGLPKPPGFSDGPDSAYFSPRPGVEAPARRSKAVMALEPEGADALRSHNFGVAVTAGSRVTLASPMARGVAAVGQTLGVSSPGLPASALASLTAQFPGKPPSSAELAAAAAYTDSLHVSAATASTSIRASFESALHTLSSVAARAALYQRQLARDGASALAQHTSGAAALPGDFSIVGSAGASAFSTAVAAATDSSARITAAASALNASADQAGVTAAVLRHIEEGRSRIGAHGDDGRGASSDTDAAASQADNTAAGRSSTTPGSYLQGARLSYDGPPSATSAGRQASSSVPIPAPAVGQTASARGRTESRLGGRYQNGYRVVDDTASVEGVTIAEGATSVVWNSREQRAASVASRVATTDGDRSGASLSASARARFRSRTSTPTSAAGLVRPRARQDASRASDLSDSWIQGLIGGAEDSANGSHGGLLAPPQQLGGTQLAATAAAWGAEKHASIANGWRATVWPGGRGLAPLHADAGDAGSSLSQSAVVDADLVAAGTSARAGQHYARALQEVQLARQRIQRAVSVGRAGHAAHSDAGQSEEGHTGAETAATPSSVLAASLSAPRLYGSLQQHKAAASTLGLAMGASMRPLTDASQGVSAASALASSTAHQPWQLAASPRVLKGADAVSTAAPVVASPEDSSPAQRGAQPGSSLRAGTAAAERTVLSDALKEPSPGRVEPTAPALEPQAFAASSLNTTNATAVQAGASNPGGALTISPRQAIAELQALRLRVEAALRASTTVTAPQARSKASAAESRARALPSNTSESQPTEWREPSAAPAAGGVDSASAVHDANSARSQAAARVASPPAAHRLLSTSLLETSFTSLHAAGSNPVGKLAAAPDRLPQVFPSTRHEDTVGDATQGSESTEGRRLADAIYTGGQLQDHPRDSRTESATARSLYYRLQFTEQQLARVMAEVAALRAGRAGTEEGPAHPA